MAQKRNILFPKTEAVLKELGENIRLARLRRNITAKLEAERAGISIATLSKIERGSPTVAMGNYMQVLFTLELEQDVRKVALDDEQTSRHRTVRASPRLETSGERTRSEAMTLTCRNVPKKLSSPWWHTQMSKAEILEPETAYIIK